MRVLLCYMQKGEEGYVMAIFIGLLVLLILSVVVGILCHRRKKATEWEHMMFEGLVHVARERMMEEKRKKKLMSEKNVQPEPAIDVSPTNV